MSRQCNYVMDHVLIGLFAMSVISWTLTGCTTSLLKATNSSQAVNMSTCSSLSPNDRTSSQPASDVAGGNSFFLPHGFRVISDDLMAAPTRKELSLLNDAVHLARQSEAEIRLVIIIPECTSAWNEPDVSRLSLRGGLMVISFLSKNWEYCKAATVLLVGTEGNVGHRRLVYLEKEVWKAW